MNQSDWKRMLAAGAVWAAVNGAIIPCGTAAEGGARPLALGGAYVGVAEDVHAVTWNPAGIAVLENTELTYSGTLTKREQPVLNDFVSDDYAAVAHPLYFGDRRGEPWAVMGLFFLNSRGETPPSEVQVYQAGFSLGKKIAENISAGISVVFYRFGLDIQNASESEDVITANLGLLWDVSDWMSVGIVVENITEPNLEFFGVENKMVRNVKPGVALYPVDNLMITCDIYDALGATKDKSADFSQDIRVGCEYYLAKFLAVRGGAHHLFSAVDQSVYYSAGIGLQRAEFFRMYPITYYLDYAFLYWPDAAAGTEETVHNLSLSFKF
ncbi:MAG: hypothetical protein NC924_09695 [Candidatus Omnitrophica bacterium]|nr:hypothetical protein [Candidatus Omnitrophota bacterium]